MKRGSIELARRLCVEIAGFTDEEHDINGLDYGSVDVAEILSAEVVRLRDIDKMVNRFLAWKLPSDFSPDAGVTFNPGHITPSSPLWPTGTNLMTAQQARQMFEYVTAVESIEELQPHHQPGER